VVVALGAIAGTIVITAMIAGAGSAQGPPKTLHLIGTAQNRVGFGPGHEPRQGDRIGGGSKIAGDDTGRSRTVCTIIGKRGLCTLQLLLSEGRLSAGAYDGASGTAVATQLSQTKTRLTITLSP
jgi:hypothetical protein